MVITSGGYISIRILLFHSLAALADGIYTGCPCILKLDWVSPELWKSSKIFCLSSSAPFVVDLDNRDNPSLCISLACCHQSRIHLPAFELELTLY